SDAGLADVHLVAVPWGEKLGIATDLIDETLPAAATRAVGDALTPADEATAEWDILLEDPLFELRLAAQAGPPAVTGISVGTVTPEEVLSQALRSLAAGAQLDLAAS